LGGLVFLGADFNFIMKAIQNPSIETISVAAIFFLLAISLILQGTGLLKKIENMKIKFN
jgi:hypothetical protein